MNKLFNYISNIVSNKDNEFPKSFIAKSKELAKRSFEHLKNLASVANPFRCPKFLIDRYLQNFDSSKIESLCENAIANGNYKVLENLTKTDNFKKLEPSKIREFILSIDSSSKNEKKLENVLSKTAQFCFLLCENAIENGNCNALENLIKKNNFKKLEPEKIKKLVSLICNSSSENAKKLENVLSKTAQYKTIMKNTAK